MTGPIDGWNDFARYLAAKRTVDDRALHRGVYAALEQSLPQLHAPLRILEIGCGIGTMVERLAAWRFFTSIEVEAYVAIDSVAANIAVAKSRVAGPSFAQFRTADFYEFAKLEQDSFDLVVANAVLDLVDLDRALPVIRNMLVPGGLAWLTVNFDGMTRLLPVAGASQDAAIEDAYHATMDRRLIDGMPSGDSRTGSALFAALPAFGFEILAAGPSDWIVFPQTGKYAADEAWFLHFIVNTIEGALSDGVAIEAQALAVWADTRHAQIDAGEMTYVAHQFDFLARRATLDGDPA